MPGARDEFTTVHEGQTYVVSQWPLPACYATSVAALAGRSVPLQRYRQRTWNVALPGPSPTDEEGPPTTAAWDFEGATLFAEARPVSETVFLGTHTCYDEPCHSWMAYYYSDGTRPPLSAAAPPETTGGGGSQGTPDATASGTGPTETAVAPSGEPSGAGPTETGVGPTGEPSAGARQVAYWGRRWLGVIALSVVVLAV